MQNIDELDEKFSIEGEVGFHESEEGLIFLTVSNKYADAEICLYGAHITGFRPSKTTDVLWMSPDSYFEVGKPIRGGIPVCFPWFGPGDGPDKPQHGFVRLMVWDVAEVSALPGGETFVRLQFCSSPETKAIWPHDFCAEMIICIGLKLNATLKITNTSGEPFTYTSALHSYFDVSDISNVAIDGLAGTSYRIHFAPEVYKQETPMLEIVQPETRFYFNTEATCTIEDAAYLRKIVVEKSGSKVTAVWNPWEENCAKIDDIPDDGYREFVCVETVNTFDDAIHLAPGQSHETTAIIGVE